MDHKNFNLWHRIGALASLVVSAITYLLTIEPSASFWDCGEFIASSYKLEVGHPPGNPVFQLIARFFTMFGDNMHAAVLVNAMSALLSALTVFFLYLTIVWLARRMVKPGADGYGRGQVIAIVGSGLVGALAYCFSDTFWFSAVEGEVYAMSSLFTAAVFWAMTMWYDRADQPHANRWIVLIAFLMGLSIGVHLLNLLCIPAIALVFYYRKCKNTNVWGSLITLMLSFVIILVILYGLEPGFVKMAQKFDLMFVNGLGMSFNSGALFYAFLLVAVLALNLLCIYKNMNKVLTVATFIMGVLLSGGVFFTTSMGVWFLMGIVSIVGIVLFVKFAKNYLRIMANISLSILVIFIGFSCYALILIRSNANTPLDENSPNNTFELAKYLSREQYGESPLFYGRTFQSEIVYNGETGRPYKTEGATMYAQEVKNSPDEPDSYRDLGPKESYVYVPEQNMLFPRMYSNDQDRHHPQFYEYWAGKCRGDQKPTSAQNIKYFNGYQMGWMYWRYFMWNFAGRQNDIQGHYFNDDGTRDYMNGNWICGIKAIDEARLGPQNNLPDHMKDNKARNVYYLLPLLLGLFGLVYHIVKNKKDAFIVFIMFFMTGIAIGIYLNMPPRQPRERDYAFVGSFSFYAIWIGLGVMALADWITRLVKKENLYKFIMPVVFVLCMLGVPVLMANENWDDHDRSEKYAARDFAKNYLGSVDKNGVLITFGDNDTFPLWYAQEVEGFRTDVRILNYTLSGMYWYVEQLYNKLYESEAIAFTLPKEYYGLGKDMIYIQDRTDDYFEVTDVLALLRDHPEKFKTFDQRGEEVIVLPTNKFKITLDIPKLVKLGKIPAEVADQVDPVIKWQIGKGNLFRHELMILDILGTNRFEREINIMNPSYIQKVFTPIRSYCVQHGMNYKLTPYQAYLVQPVLFDPRDNSRSLQTFAEESYDYFLNGYKDANGEYVPLQWGNLNADIYVDPVSDNMGTVQRQTFCVAAKELVEKGDTVRARRMLEINDEYFPAKNFCHNKYSMIMVDLYYDVFGKERAAEIWDDIYTYYSQDMAYYYQYIGTDKSAGVTQLIQECAQLMYGLNQLASRVLHDNERAEKANNQLKLYGYDI